MNWKKVTVIVNRITGDSVINILEELGAQGVALEELKDEKKNGDYIKLIAYYPNNENFSQIFSCLKNKVRKLKKFGFKVAGVEYNIELLQEKDWATSWHNYFHPLEIGKYFKVCPEWEECSSSDRYIIKITPGMAFGIGGHESTQLVLENMENYFNDIFKNFKNINLLDIGTGTGILSIAAAKMGIENILAIDKEDAAVEAAAENIKINKVENKIKIKKLNLLELPPKNKYDIILANLLTHIIINLFSRIYSLLSEEGLLILSGVTDRNKEKIYSLISEFDLSLIKKTKKGDWVSFILKKDD